MGQDHSVFQTYLIFQVTKKLTLDTVAEKNLVTGGKKFIDPRLGKERYSSENKAN